MKTCKGKRKRGFLHFQTYINGKQIIKTYVSTKIRINVRCDQVGGQQKYNNIPKGILQRRYEMITPHLLNNNHLTQQQQPASAKKLNLNYRAFTLMIKVLIVEPQMQQSTYIFLCELTNFAVVRRANAPLKSIMRFGVTLFIFISSTYSADLNPKLAPM